MTSEIRELLSLANVLGDALGGGYMRETLKRNFQTYRGVIDIEFQGSR